MATGERAPQVVSKEQAAGQTQAAAQWDTLRQMQMGQPGELAVTGAGPTELASSGPTEIVANEGPVYEEPEDFGQYQIPQSEEIEAEVLAIEDAPGKAETTWDDVAEMAQKSNKEKKQEWKQAEKKREQKEARAERKQQERIRQGKMPRERRPGEDYGDYMSALGETEWLGQQEARENYQADKRMLEEWENSGKMPEELYRRYPRKTGHMVENGGRKEMIPGESDAEYKARIEASLKMGLAREFPREVRVFPPTEEGGEPVERLEHSDEWAARLEEEGMKPPLTKTPDEMREGDDADIFRELTNNNPQYEDESDADYWGRLCWLREMQKELAAEDAEVQAEDDDFGDDLIDLGIRGSDDGGIEVVPEAPEGGAEDEGEGDDVEQGPLGAGEAKILDVDATARQITEQMLQEKINSGNMAVRALKGIIWGNMFHEAYIQHNLENVKAEIRAKQEGRESTLSNEQWKVSHAGVDRLVKAALSGFEQGLVRSEAGESMDVYTVDKNENGESVVYKYGRDAEGNEVKTEIEGETPEAKAVLARQETLEKYARGELDDQNFTEEIHRIRAELMGEGSNADVMVDNYLEVAKAVKERVDHEQSMENVLEGFRWIQGEVRRDVNSEAHLDTVGKISEKLRNSRVGRYVPLDVVAGALGVATVVATTGAKGVAKVIPVLGTMAVTGTVAAFKEAGRAEDDRVSQARSLAKGEAVGTTNYDEKMAASQYETYKAVDYTADLRAAMERAQESGDNTELVALVAQAETTQQLGDRQKIDLISFTSGDVDVMEQERMDMLVALAEAKVQLGPDVVAAENYQQALTDASEAIEQDITAKDRAFKSLRRGRMAKQGAKAAVTAFATGMVAQEVTAAFSDNTYGVIDAINNKPRLAGESDTMLAGLGRVLGIGNLRSVNDLTQDMLMGLSEEQARALTEQGYALTPREMTETVTRSETVQKAVSLKDYLGSHGTSVHRLDWGANGTTYSDGNELGLWNNASGNGFLTHMSGNSMTWGGETINFDHEVAAGNVKMLLSLSKDTQATPIEIMGHLTGDGQLEFVADDPQLQEIVANKAYAFAEVVMSKGAAPDGAEQVISFATDVGRNAVGNTVIDTVTETTTEEVSKMVYDVLGDPEVAMAVGLPIYGRKGLTHEQAATPDNGEHIIIDRNDGIAVIDGVETPGGFAPPAEVEEEPKTIDEQISEFAAGRYGAVEPARMEKYNKDLKDALAEWQQLSEERKQAIREQQGPSRVDGWALYWMYKELCDIGLIK